MPTVQAPDRIIERLNRRYGQNRGIEFTPATDEVVRGAELEATGNRGYGKNVYISTRDRFRPADGPPLIGRPIALGAVERYARGELRCFRPERSRRVVVAVFDAAGRRLSRELCCKASQATEYDEGLFVWFGPVESYCTPWSDNDPDHCQVITVDRLRAFAVSRDGR